MTTWVDDVRSILGDVGDASGATLLSIFGILGDPATAISDDIALLLADLYDGSIKNTMINRDMPHLAEFWETEQLAASKWETTVDVGGAEAFAVEDGYMYYDLNTGGVAGDDVLINSKYRWQCKPAVFSDTNTSIEKMILEFEVRVTGTLADIVEANFVMGIAETKDNDNTDNNIAVFTLDGAGNLIARTDNDGGADEDSGTIAATLGNWNKYRIEVYATGYKFYLNETLGATNEVAVPDEAMYIVIGNRSDGVGAVGLDVGNVRCWYEEVV